MKRMHLYIKEWSVAPSKFGILPRCKGQFRSSWPSAFNNVNMNFIWARPPTASVCKNPSLLGVKVASYISMRTMIWAANKQCRIHSLNLNAGGDLMWLEWTQNRGSNWAKNCISAIALPKLADSLLRVGSGSSIAIWLPWIEFFDMYGLSWIKSFRCHRLSTKLKPQ